jgi:N-hydroxyarylamine O-acetyltransferase
MNDDPVAPVGDLDAYLQRIRCASRLRADLATLAALHEAHASSIAFENLDVLWRRPILLDTASLEAKLVRAQRGGYCFEQNGLFLAVLRTLGFAVKPLAARVRYRAARTLPRTHMLLLVELASKRYIADVGFGAHSLLAPLPLDSDEPVAQHRWRYRLRSDAGARVLQLETAEGWLDLYAFTLEPQMPVDYAMANWYVSTHPESRFVTTLTMQLPTPQARHTVRDSSYTIERGGGDSEESPLDETRTLSLARSVFGLRLPEGAALPRPVTRA